MKQIEQTITTLEVAEMMETEHYKILEKLEGTKDKKTKGIIPTMCAHEIVVADYFKESTYQDAQDKPRKCYLVTKIGCDFLANKFTGEKGILFTAKYVKRFRDMEQIIVNKILPVQELSPELQLFKSIFDQVAKQELENKQIKQDVQEVRHNVEDIREIVALNPNDWRKDSSALINKMALTCGGYEHIRVIREESYKLLEQRFGVALGIRLTNKKKTMSLNGVCKSRLDKLNQLDVIAEDKKLIEGYIAIIKEMAVKYKISL
ncbi:regulatory protein Rha [Lachnotalea glycerini]|uniref:Regulatory protein Rha n=1 Tax=Lachnotalea glycerini TaxID=1763509 RepID=A0A318EL40_9FIRM|nr:Rha family transcriptional regulator [Lachnotalea glycerini]OYO76186.1 hypothetical protein CG709_15770 [Lachnotalea glycerini]PXV85129.1 regulatory protein Rha [Lachnotalea glycerini]